MAPMFSVLLIELFAAVAAQEACDAVDGCPGAEALLQVDLAEDEQGAGPSQAPQGGAFCPEFFKAADRKYASTGVQQAEEVFMQYCLAEGVAKDRCEQAAEDVFDLQGGGGIESGEGLTESMCSDLMELVSEFKQGLSLSVSPIELLDRRQSSANDMHTMDEAVNTKGDDDDEPSPPPPPAPSRRGVSFSCRGWSGSPGYGSRPCRRRGDCADLSAYMAEDPLISGCNPPN